MLDILLPFGEAQQKYHFLFTLKETETPEVASRPTAETGLEPEPQPPAEAGEAVLRGWREGTEGAEVKAQRSSPFLCPPSLSSSIGGQTHRTKSAAGGPGEEATKGWTKF